MKHLAVFLLSLIPLYKVAAQQPSPVHPFGDTLFYITAQVGSFTPQERANAIGKRLIAIAESLEQFNRDSVNIQSSEWGLNIVHEGNIIMVVLPDDTLGTGKDIHTLAAFNAEKIKQSIDAYHHQWEFKNVITRVGLAFVSLVVFLLIIVSINKGYRWTLAKLQSWKGTKIKSIKLNNYEFLNTERLIRAFGLIANILRVLCIVIALYILLPVLFSIFPVTKQWTQLIISYTISPLNHVFRSIVNYIPNLFSILIIYGFTFYAVRGFRFLADEIEKGALKISGFYPDWAKPTFNIIRFLLYAFMLIVIFPYLPGSKSPAFQGVSVFLGLLISFGSSSAIANAVAGLVITFMRPFKVGDRVRIGEISGDVIEKSMLVTRIRTIKNEEITIPNSTVLSNHTINYSANASEKGLILHTSVTIGYDAPWRTIHELLISAALRTDKIEADPKPFVLQTSLDDFYVSYQINAYTHHARGMADIYSELHKHIQDCFNEAGVEIMSPHYGALRNGNTIAIPKDYRPADYKADVFEVKKEQ